MVFVLFFAVLQPTDLVQFVAICIVVCFVFCNVVVVVVVVVVVLLVVVVVVMVGCFVLFCNIVLPVTHWMAQLF